MKPVPTAACLAIALALGAARSAAAQATGRVTGRVAMLEKHNKASPDLSDAVVWLERGAAEPAAPDTFDITISDKVYTPRVVAAPVGSTVRFPNRDPFKHNVFSVSEPNGFDLGLFGRNETRGHTFTAAGLVRVFCNIHPRMAAYVVLVHNRHYTQPANDGTFTLAAVPAGRYKLHVWHERIPGVVTQDVTVGTGEAAVRIEVDARQYRWQQHKNKVGKTYPTNAGRERY
jgi:plastocyanin